jgi:hypothetical protein
MKSRKDGRIEITPGNRRTKVLWIYKDSVYRNEKGDIEVVLNI